MEIKSLLNKSSFLRVNSRLPSQIVIFVQKASLNSVKLQTLAPPPKWSNVCQLPLPKNYTVHKQEKENISYCFVFLNDLACISSLLIVDV